MKIPLYQIDAFTSEPFKGNPAAVCPLDEWLPDRTMQEIAAENNVSETAFFLKRATDYALRWFTPTGEVDLCGHATLATAHVIFTYVNPSLQQVTFQTQSGPLQVFKNKDLLTLHFPSRKGVKVEPPQALIKGLGKLPIEVYQARDYLALFETEDDLLNLNLNMDVLKTLDTFGVIATAKGNEVDFVSRFFAPRVGIEEDPVTGSAHCTLVPFWKKRLHQTDFIAKQLSARGGTLYCKDLGDTVQIAGEAVTYLKGHIFI